MNPIRLFTDEDVYGAVSAQLRIAGFDIISTPEAGRRGHVDPAQLGWAAGEWRAPITFNVSDFARLHHDWQGRGLSHAGLIVSRQGPIGDIVRRLTSLARALDADGMRDRLEYLSNWPPGLRYPT